MTDTELIATLGGPAAVARLLGFSVSRVWNWRTRGIPARVKLEHAHLFLAAASQAKQAKGTDTEKKHEKRAA